MTRARLLKPGFFLNEELAELPYPARLLFEGLWCLADREGRLEDRPKRIKHETLPYDNEDVDELLQQLHDAGFILRYVVNGAHYIQVVHFLKHQSPHIKEGRSVIPSPTPPVHAPDMYHACTVHAPDTHDTRPSEAEAEAEAEAESVAEAEAESVAEAEAMHDSGIGRRQTPAEFKRHFADAAGLAESERGDALDALITAYRPRAPDAELLVEAFNCRTYYASKRARRNVDCRLLASWLTRWAANRPDRQQLRESAADGTVQRRKSPATAGRWPGSRATDLPDPTRNGSYASRFLVIADDDER